MPRSLAGIIATAALLLAACTADDLDPGPTTDATARSATSDVAEGSALRTNLDDVVAAAVTNTGMHDDAGIHGHVVLVRADGSTTVIPTRGAWFGRIEYAGGRILTQDRTTDYGIGASPFAVTRSFDSVHHSLLMTQPDGSYSAWFATGIPEGEQGWRYDLSIGGPPLRHIQIPVMGIHAVAHCDGRDYFLQGAEVVQFAELTGETTVKIGMPWSGEPPAGLTHPMRCRAGDAVAVMMRGGDPQRLGLLAIEVVSISLRTGQPRYLPATRDGAPIVLRDPPGGPSGDQLLTGDSLRWGDALGRLNTTSVTTGVTTTAQAARTNDANPSVMWRFTTDRAVAFDDATGQLTAYRFDGTVIGTRTVPQLRGLVTGTGERMTDFALVHPELLS